MMMIRLGDSKIHGRGVFADEAIRAGVVIETSHLLALACGEGPLLARTRAGAYAFYIDECPDHPGEERVGIALSLMTFLNHSRNPNVDFAVDPIELVVRFTARRNIPPDEELTIDYGEFADKLGLNA